MRRLAESRFTRQLVIPLTLVALFSACHKWSTVQEDPRDFIHRNDVREEPGENLLGQTNSELKVRVGRRSGGEIELVDPFIRGDMLVGSRNGEEVAIPLADVRKLDERTFDGLGTGFLIGAVVIVAGGLIAGTVAASKWDCCL